MSLTINNGLIIGLEPRKPTKAQPEEPEPTKQEETPDTNEEQLNNVDDGTNIH